MTQKSLWVRFSVVSPSSFTWRRRASERARSPGYRGPAHAAPQRSLVAAACASLAALSACRCQQFPRFLPLECDPLAAGAAGRAGNASFASLVSLRSPLFPAPRPPLFLRGRASTPSLLPPLQLSQAHSHWRLETCTPSRLSGNSSSPAGCSQGENFTSSAGWVAAGVAPPARRS